MRNAAAVVAISATLIAARAARTRADDDAPVPKPMAVVADVAAVCAPLRADLDAKVACKSVAHAKLTGGATVDVYAVNADIIRYAVVVVADGKTSVSPAVELEPSNCGMMKCDVLDAQTPRLRTIRGGALAVLEIAARYHHQSLDDSAPHPKPVIGDRWQASDYVACGKASGGALTCVTRHWGGRGHSCKSKLADDGQVGVTCDDVEQLSLD